MFLVRSLNRICQISFHQSSVKFVPMFNFSTTPNIQMSVDEVEGKIYELLRMMPKCKSDKISRKATFDELGLDSLDAVETIVSIEEMFGVDLPDKVAESITDVNTAIESFHKHINQANKVKAE